MGYISMGDVATDSFNSTKYPGVCKPSTVATLAVFKRLQAQLNRVASVKGIATIAVDGDVGAGTVGLYASLKSALISYASSSKDISFAFAGVAQLTAAGGSCTSIASVADVIADVADAYADSLGASASPPAPKPIAPPTLVSKTGVETAPPV